MTSSQSPPSTSVSVADARSLATTQRDLRRDPWFLTHFAKAKPVSRTLIRAHTWLAANTKVDARLQSATESFLDNFYLIRRVARQVEEELPRGFVRHLPQLASGVDEGTPRVEALARALVAQGGLTLSFASLRSFVNAYQEVTALTIAELWALPTVLRAAVLAHLIRDLAELGVEFHADDLKLFHVNATSASGSADPAVGVAQSVHALRVLDALDWKVFFEDCNRVEAILLTDPAQVYGRMDFETCDSYRKVVEALAWGTGRSEIKVATLAVELAAKNLTDKRRGHVGYYLVAEGKTALEAELKFRPIGLERLRRALTRWPTVAYLAPLVSLTILPLAALLFYATLGTPQGVHSARFALLLLGALVAVIPFSALVVSFLHLVFARVLAPRILPKLDLSDGLTPDLKTLVVMPTLLGRAEDVVAMVRQIELHYLANPDPQLQFALLTDDLDAKALPDTSEIRVLLESVSRRIVGLNAKHGVNGVGPFHLLHRDPLWNPAEERFIGWERKRGKLDELNRLLRGDLGTTYRRHVGDSKGLEGVSYVITLDSDTELPLQSAHRLVGLLAHPLNHPVFNAEGRVVAGYTIAQPRIETSPSSVHSTWFSRIFSGDIGFDIYTHACSELYQDLFGAGIYVGKGIYDVDAFMRSVEGRAPENALVSHDLFEGVHGRTALATDIVLFESYPSNYAVYASRMHRWVRGDWQLFPWLFGRDGDARKDGQWNTLNRIDRWKIADNIRRSLNGTLLFLLLFLGWTVLPGSPVRWTLAALGLLVGPHLPGLFSARRTRTANAWRSLLALVFLAYESAVVMDAMGRVVVRKLITRKHLLQWTSAAHSAFGIAARSQRAVFWKTMLSSPLLAIGIAWMVAWLRPTALISAAPILLLWLLAPEIARILSATRAAKTEQTTEEDRKKLRLIARRTWAFFEAFVGPRDQWLPIDNYQEEPREQIAHRTSPTNIGLSLVATLSAYDFGYIGPSEFAIRVRRAVESILRLEHYQGHLLNWYDTTNLQPLLPRYVSTVDSGNLAGCLLTLSQGCADVSRSTVVRPEMWEGFLDSLELLEGAVSGFPKEQIARAKTATAAIKSAAANAKTHLDGSYETLCTFINKSAAHLDTQLLALVESDAQQYDRELLHALRNALDALHKLIGQMQRELLALLPWLALREDADALAMTLPTNLRIDEIPAVCVALGDELRRKSEALEQLGTLTPELAHSTRRINEALALATSNAQQLHNELLELAAFSLSEVRAMDFKLLYNPERKLFHIGYNATIDQLDANFYDLLASEARLASYLAVVKRDAPEAHWFALGRQMTLVNNVPTLLSWGGTMFEFLMPSLLMRSQPDTLLARTCALAVDAQVDYGKLRREPWGVSESGYARVDAEQTYQYRSFGVPALGLRRGLEVDRVISPYACILAVSIRPRAVVENLAALEATGMLGTYGFYEALDHTPHRVLEMAVHPQPYVVVRSYMAHHQGMSLIALGNYLNKRSMVDRFHAVASVSAGEMLLNERASDAVPAEWLSPQGSPVEPARESLTLPQGPSPWLASNQSSSQAFVLSNGRLSSVLTGSGGGGLFWKGMAVTRFTPDPTRDEDGLWLFLRDEATKRVWFATAVEGRTTYAMHKAEFHQRHDDISVHVEVAIAEADDVEVRHITLHNESDRKRQITVTSAGRPVLLDAKQAPTHPAFSSLFVQSEWVQELDALVFERRAQTPEEETAVLVHRLVHDASVDCVGYETDRSAFVGRGGSWREPAAVLSHRGPYEGQTGAVLDPVMSITARVELEPNSSVSLAFVTVVASSRTAALELARKKYATLHAVRWVFPDAALESPRRLLRTKLDPSMLPVVQRFYSALLLTEPKLRAEAHTRALSSPSQVRLWSRGISGDDPIVLIRVCTPQALMLPEVLAAQSYLRFCGVRFDLVLVDEQASGYIAEGSGTLRSVLVAHDAERWLDRHGGVFVIAGDQVPEDEVRHLEACARIVLHTKGTSLASCFDNSTETHPVLPRFEPTLVDETFARAPVRPKLLFDNEIAGFSEDGREYVIEVQPANPLPAPWCNVIANPEFGCLVSESSLGMSWSQNSGANRLTPWRNDAVQDTPSEVLYLRDEETAAVWSPTRLPAGRGAQTVVRHGAGYTTYERESHGLVQELTVFVPTDASLKVVRLRLKNTLARHRRLTATYYAEWVLGARREVQRDYIVSSVDHEHACLLATCDWNVEFAGRVAFVASSANVHAFTADRTEFLGQGGDYARPAGLERVGLSGRLDSGADPCAALQVHLELAPGEELETHFVLGQSSSRAAALELIKEYRDPATVAQAFGRVKAYWDQLLGNIRVKTPEPSMDLMLNRWLLYQTVSARLFARTGLYQSSGAFGYRDQLQDVMALLHTDPSIARAHILDAARHQFEQGDVLHWWHPPSGRGVRTRCSDDLAWLPYVTSEYVRATGDHSILDESVPFLKGELLKPDEHDRYAQYETSSLSAPVIEHCRRALQRAVSSGVHGLPLMGDGDWNDGMSRIGAQGRGESVWLGWFLCATMDRFANVFADHNDAHESEGWLARSVALRAKINACAWDGDWYVRAFHDDTSVIGSHDNRECRIDSIAQSWAAISATESALKQDEPRILAALRAVDQQLVNEDERLVKLFWPPFDATTHDPGYVRAYPPGIRENGGQYTHAAAWLGMSYSVLGDGDNAERIFRLLNPILRTGTRVDAALYRVEPYVLAADIYSCAPWVGRGGWTWYTGSAAWMWRLGVESILGIQMRGGQLWIDPCIPAHWPGFEAWVRVGEASIHVVVENAVEPSAGHATSEMILDGAKLETQQVLVDSASKGAHELHVKLFRRAAA
ncbi:MAG: glucoamylase family protein [Deltaproteobacteria bacterium]|nr:glucoamylase family protein [Deltaproteobacteria bacterium]